MPFMIVLGHPQVVILGTLHSIEKDGGGLIIFLTIPEKAKAKKRRFGAHPDG